MERMTESIDQTPVESCGTRLESRAAAERIRRLAFVSGRASLVKETLAAAARLPVNLPADRCVDWLVDYLVDAGNEAREELLLIEQEMASTSGLCRRPDRI